MLDCVSFALGENLAAKPSKIVSGQEPQKTNEFLQALAQIIDKKIGKYFTNTVLQVYDNTHLKIVVTFTNHRGQVRVLKYIPH